MIYLARYIVIILLNTAFYLGFLSVNFNLIISIVVTSIIDILIIEIDERYGKGIFSTIFFLIDGILKMFIPMYYRFYGFYPKLSDAKMAGNLGDIKEHIIYNIKGLETAIFILTVTLLVINIYSIFNYIYETNIFVSLFEDKTKYITILCLVALTLIYFANHVYFTEFYGSLLISLKTDVESDGNYKFKYDKDGKINFEKNPVLLEIMEKNKHKNQYTGLGKGKNLIVIQVESLQNNFINKKYNGQEITPFINKLINTDNTIYFDEYFQEIGYGHTADAEFVSMYGLFPYSYKTSYEIITKLNIKNYGLVDMAKNKGYTTIAAHGYKEEFYDRRNVYEKLGFDNIYLGNDFNQIPGTGSHLPDKNFFEEMSDKIKNHSDKPFFSFLVTLSNHTPFKIYNNEKCIQLLKKDEDTLFGDYINSLAYFDRTLEEFFQKLKKDGILENTVIAIYGDHGAISHSNKYQSKRMKEFLGREYLLTDELKIPLIFVIPGLQKHMTVNNIASHIDFLPMITNIMGWNDETAPMFGHDILGENITDNNVYVLFRMKMGSFVNKNIIYKFYNGYEVTDRKTLEKLDHDKYIPISVKGKKQIELSHSILEQNKIIDLIKNYKEYKKE